MRFGRGIDRVAGLAAAVMAAGILAAPAQAQISQEQYAYNRSSAVPVGYVFPGAAQAVLTVQVTASVGGTCGFAAGTEPNATINKPNIDTTGWSAQVPFTAQCTAPWRIAVSSQNGALQNAATVPTGYQNRAPYAVTVNVPFDTGSSSGTVTSTCPVAEIDQALGSSPCNFKGTASTTNGLPVPRSFDLPGSYIGVAAPAYPGPDILVEGTYTDVLTVTVSPAI
jgi:hypothetical protein